MYFVILNFFISIRASMLFPMRMRRAPMKNTQLTLPKTSAISLSFARLSEIPFCSVW